MGVTTMTSWYSNWSMHYEGMLLNTILVCQLRPAISFPPYVLCSKAVLADRNLRRQRGETWKKLFQRIDEPLSEFAELTLQMAADGYSGMGGGGEWIQVLVVDAFLMGCTDKRSTRSALDRDPKTVDEAVSLMRRFHGHEKALSVEKRVRILALEEGDPVALQVNRVQEERSCSLDFGELNENIEKLTKLLANINMVGPGHRMGHVKCVSCGETGHIASYCRTNVQRPYPRRRDGVYVKAAQ